MRIHKLSSRSVLSFSVTLLLFAVPTLFATVTYHGNPATLTVVGTSNFANIKGATHTHLPLARMHRKQLPFRTPGKPMQLRSNAGAPAITSQAGMAAQPYSQVLYNFNGLSNFDNGTLTGFIFEPPDQALCVGNLLGKKTVIEGVNVTLGFYDPNGTLQGEDDFFSFFQDNDLIVSDPRCVYDKTDDAFFITVVGTDDAT